ncbi:MAG: hypothetical protein ACKO34_03020 [Vampirovibrionales bacterium]
MYKNKDEEAEELHEGHSHGGSGAVASYTPREGGYQSRGGGGGYQQREGGYQPRGGGGGYQQREGGYQSHGGGVYQQRQGGYPQRSGGFQSRGGPGGFRRGAPPRRMGGAGAGMFVPPDKLAVIERSYKTLLPLPNPDTHEVLAKQLEMNPKVVFFAINLIRTKMMLPKVEFPKRPLAVTPEQLLAVQALYEPYLPTPPIGVHKIISKQLRMDEWRVHVAIKLIRKSHHLPRWNEERDDLPPWMQEELQKARERQGDAEREVATEAQEAERLKALQEEAASTPLAQPVSDTDSLNEEAS